jgi:hypothetical protein
MNVQGTHHIPEEEIPRIKILAVHETANWATESRRIGWINVYFTKINLGSYVRDHAWKIRVWSGTYNDYPTTG